MLDTDVSARCSLFFLAFHAQRVVAITNMQISKAWAVPRDSGPNLREGVMIAPPKTSSLKQCATAAYCTGGRRVVRAKRLKRFRDLPYFSPEHMALPKRWSGHHHQPSQPTLSLIASPSQPHSVVEPCHKTQGFHIHIHLPPGAIDM